MGAAAEEFNKHDASVMFMTKSHDENFLALAQRTSAQEFDISKTESVPCHEIGIKNKTETIA
jgi:hypothetical protein